VTALRRPLQLSAAVLAAGLLAAAFITGPDIASTPDDERLPDIQLVGTSGATPNELVTNSLDGRPILTVNSIGPGQSRSGQLTLRNAGSAAQSVSVWQSGLTTGPAGRPNLAAWVRLTVYDAALNKNVFSGPYANFATTAAPLTICGVPTKKATCPAWDKGETHAFTFTVTFPDTAAGVNAYQSTWLRSQFNWTSVH